MNSVNIKKIEIDMLLSAIKLRYGYDFSEYSKASLSRRIENRRILSGVDHISDLIPRILYSTVEMNNFIHDLSVTVTEMFRDPRVYVALKNNVLPVLATYPRIKIWHAGCATGEEVYSMAIILQEAGIYDRVQIYATDISEENLEVARKGIYPYDLIKKYTENYHEAGGEFSFSNYYHAKYDHVIINDSLKENIVFSNHNLVNDKSFGEMQLIMCRNVLIYFNRNLQNKVFSLFNESLSAHGFICLGLKESMDFYDLDPGYEKFLKDDRIFKKNIKW